MNEVFAAEHRISKKRRNVLAAVAGLAVVGGGASAAVSASAGTAVTRPAPQVFTGRAFDTCTAPSLTTMNAWHASSPYKAAAVYIGGKNRGCSQPQLTAPWVKSVSASGWKLIPLYVGAQPPCQTGSSSEKMTASTAAKLGASDADAVAQAVKLGMKTGSPVYNDMEVFDLKNTSCKDAVITYTRAWDAGLHAKGYAAGFYGFTSSAATAVATASDRGSLTDTLWYAKWDGVNSTTSGYPFARHLWNKRQRGHQYAVNVKETDGKATLTIDRDAWAAPVAIVAK